MDYIYFLHDRTTGTIKIGASSDPESQMKSLQASMPLDLTPVRYVRVQEGGRFGVERFLHKKFADLCVRGEWFQATPELLDFARTGEIPDQEDIKEFLAPPPTIIGKGMWTLKQLCKHSGLSPRTIRYYIAQNLIPGPLNQGRSALYDEACLETLRVIRKRQKEGLSLEQIRRGRDPKPDSLVPQPDSWRAYKMVPDVEVWVQENIPPHRSTIIQRAVMDFYGAVMVPETDVDEGEAL